MLHAVYSSLAGVSLYLRGITLSKRLAKYFWTNSPGAYPLFSSLSFNLLKYFFKETVTNQIYRLKESLFRVTSPAAMANEKPPGCDILRNLH